MDTILKIKMKKQKTKKEKNIDLKNNNKKWKQLEELFYELMG